MSTPDTQPESHVGKCGVCMYVCVHTCTNLICFVIALTVVPSSSSAVPSAMPSPMPVVTPSTSAEGRLGKGVYIWMNHKQL